MKKKFTYLAITLFSLVLSSGLFAQGLEDFTNYPEIANSYHDGSFTGLDGSTWTYFQCRGDSVIAAPTPTLGKNRTPTSEVSSGLIANGIGTLKFDFEQVFSTNVSLDVLVNDVLITTITTTGEQGIVKNTGDIAVNVSGTFTLKFIQSNTSAGQVSIDNVSWTAFGGGTPDPEPTNYPTSFAASGKGLSLHTYWTDATGTQLPAAYLIKVSTTDNIASPIDGTFAGDDLDLSDGTGSKNVAKGIQEYTFKGLNATTTYYLKIFPYTNAGSLVDYKTNGTIPSASARTQAVLYEQSFENGLAPWTEFSVLGEQLWSLDSIHGVDGSMCMKMTGFVSSTSTIANEDWLISPAMTIAGGSSPVLEFHSAMNYATGSDDIMAFISTDYTGGDPSTNGNWSEFSDSPVFSPGGWAWTSSGFLDISDFTGDNVRVAFKYTCGIANAPTWEFDNIRVTVNSGVGYNELNPVEGKSLIQPNPCSDGFRVASAKGAEIVSILSLSGQLLNSSVIEDASTIIPTSNLKPGIYLVKIRGHEMKEARIQKLVIR